MWRGLISEIQSCWAWKLDYGEWKKNETICIIAITKIKEGFNIKNGKIELADQNQSTF